MNYAGYILYCMVEITITIRLWQWRVAATRKHSCCREVCHISSGSRKTRQKWEFFFWWSKLLFIFYFFSRYCGFSTNTDRTFLDRSSPTAD